MKRSTPLASFYRDVYEPLTLPADATREDYHYVVRKFSRWLAGQRGHAIVEEITPELLGQYFRWLIHEDGRSGKTAGKHGRTLKAILREAKRKKLTKIDLDEVPRPKADKLRPRAWSIEQFRTIVLTAGKTQGCVGPWPASDWLQALFLTTFVTDWRISAIMRIRTVNCDLDRLVARTMEKRRCERTAKLTPACAKALRKIWGPRDEVFGDWPKDRHSRQWAELNDLFGRVIAAANVPDIGRFHAIRKSAVTYIVDQHGLEAGARFAGHSSSRITWEHYVDDSLLTDSSIIDSLPEFEV